MMASPSKPPTTPPAIGPALLFFEEIGVVFPELLNAVNW